MKKFLLFVLIASQAAHGQIEINRNINATSGVAYDISGKPISAKSPEIILGSQMLNSDWGRGMIYLKNGKIVRDIELQFNLLSNELYFLRNGIRLQVADTVQSFFISFKEGEESKSGLFRAGYPASGRLTENTFYEIVEDGPNVQIIQYLSKVLVQQNNYGKGQEKEYVMNSQFYIFDVKKNKISKFKKDKSALLKALPSLTLAIEELYKEKSPDLRSEEELKEFIKSLNAR